MSYFVHLIILLQNQILLYMSSFWLCCCFPLMHQLKGAYCKKSLTPRLSDKDYHRENCVVVIFYMFILWDLLLIRKTNLCIAVFSVLLIVKNSVHKLKNAGAVALIRGDIYSRTPCFSQEASRTGRMKLCCHLLVLTVTSVTVRFNSCWCVCKAAHECGQQMVLLNINLRNNTMSLTMI